MQVVQNKKYMDGNNMMGWAKIAFTYGINHLREIIDKNEE